MGATSLVTAAASPPQNFDCGGDRPRRPREVGAHLTELGLERELMGRVAKLKLQYFGHITRGSAGQLTLTVLEGIIEGLRHQGRPRRQWIHDIEEEWTGCEYIQLKEVSQDRGSSTMEKKDIGVVVCCRQPSSRKVD